MSATTPTTSPTATPTKCPEAPRKAIGCGKRAAEEAGDASPAKKYCVGEEKTYETFKAWVIGEGLDAVYKNVKDRYNKDFGVEEFADLYKGDDIITSWEQYDHRVREVEDYSVDTLLDVMDHMVKQMRDQNDLIEVLRSENAGLKKAI